MRELLKQAARSFRVAPAFMQGDSSVDFQRLPHIVEMRSHTLLSLGVEGGDWVGYIPDNKVSSAEFLFATNALGATPFLFNRRWPQQQLDEVLASLQLKAKWLDVGILKLESQSKKVQELLEPGSSMVLFTSGSMGFPKAVVLSASALTASASALSKVIAFSPGDSWLAALPIYHVGGLAILFRSLVSGGAVVFPEEDELLIETIERQKVTHLSLVPTQLRRLLADAKFRADSDRRRRRLFLGGSALPQELISEAIARGFLVYTSYGMTETGSACVVGTCNKTDEENPSNTITLRSGEIRVGTDSEIFVRGESLFSGYLKDNKVVCPVDDAGWFATGDFGQFNDRGVFRVTGRKDNMFISGGENIHPEEIERALRTIPEIVEAVVVPIRDKEFGEKPVAFVSLTQELSLNDYIIDRVQVELRKQIAGFKLPARYLELPTEYRDNPKPNRKKLKEFAVGLLNSE